MEDNRRDLDSYHINQIDWPLFKRQPECKTKVADSNNKNTSSHIALLDV